ncbi:MAG: serine hydrolase [Planctomycetota bacterium]|nr:serine hydrolase [Planctomycetota bacterium]
MKRLFLLLLACTVLGPNVPAQDPTAPPTETAPTSAAKDAIGGARQLALALIAAGAPGLSAAVAVNGEVVWAEGFGYADVELGIPVQTTTRFRVGSVAKAFTAAGLVLLVEEGRLDLDAPVQEYVPSFPVKEEGEITTRLLAGHLSGIRHYKGIEYRLERRFDTVLDGLSIFADDPLVNAPGERFSYTTYGWSLIAAAMETASEREFLAFMDERVFRPVGMHCTVADRADVVIPGRTTYYRMAGGELVVCPPVDNSYKWAGGGFLSTAEDMVRFGSAHLEPGFLEQETLDLLFTSQKTTSGEETNIGIAWFLSEDEEGRRIYSHGGGSVGGTTALAIHPESRVVAALTTNRSQGPVSMDHARKLLALFEPE